MDGPSWRRVNVGGSLDAPPVPITVSAHRVGCGDRLLSRPQAVSPAFVNLRQPSLFRLALESAGVCRAERPQITVAPARLAGLTPDPPPAQPPPLQRRVVIRQPPPEEPPLRQVDEPPLQNSWRAESSPCKRLRVTPPYEYLECPICMDSFPGDAVDLHVADCFAELEEEHKQWTEWERSEREAARTTSADIEPVETEVEFVVEMEQMSFIPSPPLSPMALPPELVEGTVEFERKKRQRELELKLQMIELYKDQLKEAMMRQQASTGRGMTSA